MHNDLFRMGHSRAEVRDSIKSDYSRDHRTLQIFDIIFGLCVVFLVRHLAWLDAAAVAIAAATGVWGMRYFVDQSVRNFYLHRIDWDEAGADDPRG